MKGQNKLSRSCWNFKFHNVSYHCLLSMDNSHVLYDPSDTSPPFPSISIEKEECFKFILDQMTVNFSNGQVPWQCFMCGDTVPQVQYHTKCLFCSASVVDNAKLLLHELLSILSNMNPNCFLKMTGSTPQKTCVKLEYLTLVSILLSPHARLFAGLTC